MRIGIIVGLAQAAVGAVSGNPEMAIKGVGKAVRSFAIGEVLDSDVVSDATSSVSDFFEGLFS